MPYTGRLYIAELTDRKVPNRWFKTYDDMRRKFARRDEDREKVETLVAAIAREGQRKPVELGVNYRGNEVTFDDGNHRLLALQQLGHATITFNWYDTGGWGVRMSDEPFDYGRWGLTNPDA